MNQLLMYIERILDWKHAADVSYVICEGNQQERYRLERNRADQIHNHLLSLLDLGVQF